MGGFKKKSKTNFYWWCEFQDGLFSFQCQYIAMSDHFFLNSFGIQVKVHINLIVLYGDISHQNGSSVVKRGHDLVSFDKFMAMAG